MAFFLTILACNPKFKLPKINNSQVHSLKNFEAVIASLPLGASDKDRLLDALNALGAEQAITHAQTIEEKQKYQQELIKMQEALDARQHTIVALEKAYQEMEAFSNIVAHDLSNPIRTISNFAQILQMQCENELSDSAKEFLQFIISGTKNMQKLVNDLLEWSKAGKVQTEKVEVDLNVILTLVTFNLKPQINAHKAIIKIPKPLPTLYANKSSLIQLFQNLIENSIKFRSDATPEISILWDKIEEHLWEFKVIDNGIGMVSSFEDKAFLPFQRLNNRNGAGNGIGLAVCRKILQTYQGDIRFERNDGGGTTFVFTIKDNNNTSLITEEVFTEAKETLTDNQTA
jgi:light-regulated signal transduction histidine kinase (bacteriophytochrome)